MTDKKISELTSITGANVSDANDVLPIVDTSVATTKKITRAELFKSVSSVDINGGTIDGVTIGGASAGAGTFSSLVATTADINGGTIDGTVIGGTSPAAISGTTGTFSGGVYLGGITSANLLDDYEEGTWTPTLNATSFSGATYDAQTGTYTKIGDTVHAWAYVSLSALSSGGGNYLRIEGLPFLPAATGAPAIVASENLTGGTAGDYIISKVFAGSNQIGFYEYDETGLATAVGMQGSRLTATSNFYVQVSYKV